MTLFRGQRVKGQGNKVTSKKNSCRRSKRHQQLVTAPDEQVYKFMCKVSTVKTNSQRKYIYVGVICRNLVIKFRNITMSLKDNITGYYDATARCKFSVTPVLYAFYTYFW